MPPPLAIPPRYRAAAAAVAASAAVHAAALLGLPSPSRDEPDLDLPAYSATLDAAAAVAPAPAPAAAPRPRPHPRPKRAAPRPHEAVAYLPAIAQDELEPLRDETEPAPDLLALAEPAVPIVVAPEPPAFHADALPPEVTISYSLTSAFADGEAEYTWKRDGEHYEITGSAQAVGFFAVFLEGRIDQSASGTVTATGLRPDRFTERRGSTPEEGLDFDWKEHKVEFRRGDTTRTGKLTDSTVDWLSMIFQLAHVPPRGRSMELRVYTQRRLYEYHLQVLGRETLDLPFGRADTLHLRHTDEKDGEVVDVWLGIDQHYLPVKLRYPVARNRLVVEQTATSVRAR